jgi:hypothetical protein
MVVCGNPSVIVDINTLALSELSFVVPADKEDVVGVGVVDNDDNDNTDADDCDNSELPVETVLDVVLPVIACVLEDIGACFVVAVVVVVVVIVVSVVLFVVGLSEGTDVDIGEGAGVGIDVGGFIVKHDSDTVTGRSVAIELVPRDTVSVGTSTAANTAPDVSSESLANDVNCVPIDTQNELLPKLVPSATALLPVSMPTRTYVTFIALTSNLTYCRIARRESISTVAF